MNSLEQAALSGSLTDIRLPPPSHHDPRHHPHRRGGSERSVEEQEEEEEDDDDLSSHRSADSHPSHLDPAHPHHSRLDEPSLAANLIGSSGMSRGWSGNTGPKGVLIDFKASHGKSGAILGGDDIRPPSSVYYRQISMSSALASKRATNAYRQSTPSDSDSDLSDREHLTGSNLFQSTRPSAARLTISTSGYHFSQPLFGSSASPASSPISNSGSRSSKLDSRGKRLFGHLREVGVENFIQAVEAEKDDKETVVLVHLYDPALESCATLNHHLSNLARAYPRTKFLRALASELDFLSEASTKPTSGGLVIPTVGLSPTAATFRGSRGLNLMDDEHDPFGEDLSSNEVKVESRTRKATDSDVLPTLIWYRSGEYVQSLPALEREMPLGEIVKGDRGCKDLQRLLKRHGIINE